MMYVNAPFKHVRCDGALILPVMRYNGIDLLGIRMLCPVTVGDIGVYLGNGLNNSQIGPIDITDVTVETLGDIHPFIIREVGMSYVDSIDALMSALSKQTLNPVMTNTKVYLVTYVTSDS